MQRQPYGYGAANSLDVQALQAPADRVLLDVRAASPVQVGSGEIASPLEYLVDTRLKPWRICFLSAGEVFDALSEFQQEALLRYIETAPSPSLAAFLTERLQNAGVTHRLCERSRHRPPLGVTEARRRIWQTGRGLPIERFISSVAGPYLPGSSLKGALRTALLYAEIADHPERLRRLEEVLGAARHARRERELEQAADHDVLRHRANAIHDALKGLEVADSPPLAADQMAVTEIEVVGTTRPMRPCVEVMRTGTQFSMEITLRPRVAAAVGFSRDRVERLLSLSAILAACARFSAAILEADRAYFNERGQEDVVRHIEELQEQNDPRAPLVRVGKQTGYLSLTLGLLVKEHFPELYQQVVAPLARRNRHRTDLPFPKVRHLVDAATRKTLGWLQLVAQRP